MEFIVFSATAKKPGGHSFTFTPIGDRVYSEIGSYGSAVQRVQITACVARSAANLTPNERDVFKTIPRVTFSRHRKQIDLVFQARHVLLRSESRRKSVKDANLAMQDISENIQLIRSAIRPSDDFNVVAFLDDVERVLSIPIKAEVEFDFFELQARSKAENAPEIQETIPDDPKYHPMGRKILHDPAFWSLANELPPHGSDLTSALLHQFETERTFSKRTSRVTIVKRLLKELCTAPQLELFKKASKDKESFDDNPADYWTANEIVLAAAGGEIKLRGKCDSELLALSIAATRRHLRPFNVEIIRESFAGTFVTQVSSLRKCLVKLQHRQRQGGTDNR